MDTREAGRRGAKITNSKLTKEQRTINAKRGWRKLKALQRRCMHDDTVRIKKRTMYADFCKDCHIRVSDYIDIK